MYVCALHASLVSVEVQREREYQNPWSKVMDDGELPTVGVLRIEPGSFVGAASALNY